MSEMTAITEHLAHLVSFDTQNPPRDIPVDHPMFDYLDRELPGFNTTRLDHERGRVSYYARRGRPKILFNVHLDTVPTSSNWTRDPFTLASDNDRAYGLGACDIKGAAACLLHLAAQDQRDLALLFTTDEEGSEGRCVKAFCESDALRQFDHVVVAEPTACQARLSHRGYLSVIGEFHGAAGHSSQPEALAENAIHKFSQWAAAAVSKAAEQTGDQRSCFNIGRVEGGTKSNVIADFVHAHYSARLPAGQNNADFAARINALGDAQWRIPFSAPPFPASLALADQAESWMRAHGVEIGSPVDFWTEAALFSAAGACAVVLGPGHIAQAHTADEWVELEQLAMAYAHYEALTRGR